MGGRERERQKGSCTEERGGFEEARAVMKWLTWVAVCHRQPWWYLALGCSQGPCPDPWSCHNFDGLYCMRSSCYYWRPCSHLKLGHHILPCWCPRNVPPWRCSRCQRPQTGLMINYNERLQVKMYRLKRVVPFCLFIFFFFVFVCGFFGFCFSLNFILFGGRVARMEGRYQGEGSWMGSGGMMGNPGRINETFWNNVMCRKNQFLTNKRWVTAFLCLFLSLRSEFNNKTI